MSATDGQITRQARPHEDLIPPLDATRFKPSDEEWAFLRTAISDDDAQITQRIMEIQKECVDVYWLSLSQLNHIDQLCRA